jgi:SAM-dependent methyltransferase
VSPSPDELQAACWRRYDAIEARLTAGVSERMLDLAGLSPGMRVLDIATGRGEPALRAAQRVGPTGQVLGIDRNDGVLEIARELARAPGLSNLELRCADAETFALTGRSFDAATARWCLMYFEAPHQALARIHLALAPGGVLVAAVWAEPERVPYATLAQRTLSRFREVPPVPEGGPGVFRFSDPAEIHRAWTSSGFRIEAIEEQDVPVIEAAHGEGIVAWYRALSAGGWLRSLIAELPEETQRAWEQDLAREAERYRVGDRILLGGVTRLVLARRG